MIGERIGEIQSAKRVGYKSNHLVIWSACELCGKERWVQESNGKPHSKYCPKCSNNRRDIKTSMSQEGSKHYHTQGYVLVMLYPSSPYFGMADYNGYILEHRLVMAKHLMRMLSTDELVHHGNGIKDDNRLENLEVTYRKEHFTEHSNGYSNGYKRGYEDGKRQALVDFPFRDSQHLQ